MDSITLEMLPAAEGDALLLSYGQLNALNYVLIDGGRRSTYKHLRERILALPLNVEGNRFFELLIVTHVDADHIEGIICLLQDEELKCQFGDVWFNDWVHLEPLTAQDLGVAQGEFLGALLQKKGLTWNAAFSGEAAVLTGVEDALPIHALPGGLELTLLSPSVDTLIELRSKWTKAIEAAGFRPGNREQALEQFAEKSWANLPRNLHLGDEDRSSTLDHSEANGSSIAVIASYRGVRLLLAGDAWANVLRPALDRWRADHEQPNERIKLHGFKVPHHGSKKNMSPQLMNVIDCPAYLVSTSGSRFKHPDIEAIKIILNGHAGEGKPELLFNYKSDDNDFWARHEGCVVRYEDNAILNFQFTE